MTTMRQRLEILLGEIQETKAITVYLRDALWNQNYGDAKGTADGIRSDIERWELMVADLLEHMPGGGR